MPVGGGAYGAACLRMLVIFCCNSLSGLRFLVINLLNIMAVKARAAGCVIFLCVCVVCSVLPVRAQSIFDVPKEMVDHASGKAMDMLRHDQGRLDDDTPPPADMPVDVSLDVSVKAGLPGVRSFVVGPVFNASDNVPVNKRVIVPETQQDLVIRGVIIAPDVSFVDMADADMYFDFVQKNLMQSVIVIGFKDFNETATVQVGHSYIGQAMTLQTLRRMLSELQGYIRAVDAVNYRVGRIAMYGIFVLMGVLLWSSISKTFFLPTLWTLEMA